MSFSTPHLAPHVSLNGLHSHVFAPNLWVLHWFASWWVSLNPLQALALSIMLYTNPCNCKQAATADAMSCHGHRNLVALVSNFDMICHLIVLFYDTTIQIQSHTAQL